MRVRSRGCLVIALACLSACDAQRARLILDVPPTAQGRITSVRVILSNDGSEVCNALAFWATGSCGSACDEAEMRAALPAAPTRDEMLTPNASGLFGAPELDIGGSERWDVIVIASVEGLTDLYGCRSVTPGGGNVDLALWWPWCAAEACDRQFHSGCDASIDCSGVGPLLDPLSPTCASTRGTIQVWEQGGVACAAPSSSSGPCHTATVRCEAGMLRPETDGVCPGDPTDEPCVTDASAYISAMDLDCDGAHPLCDVTPCTARDSQVCGSARCMGLSRCTDGVFGECTFSEVELCNGVDDDCDTAIDEDPEALISCNVRRPPTAPAADACSGSECRCGPDLSCDRAGIACCGGACVDITGDVRHCGGCDMPCAGDQRCNLGSCNSTTVDAGVPPDCVDVADCNLTHRAAGGCMGGSCVCGDGAACAFPSICCGGECVNPEIDPRHCGMCDRPCAFCLFGRCRD